MLRFIDNLLNSITMYRVVLYGLVFLAGLAVIFSFFGLVSIKPLSLILSLLILIVSCYISNTLISKIFKIPVNNESHYITALILFFIFEVDGSLTQYILLALSGVIAMLSKFILTYRKKHIFNPAALSVFIIGFFGVAASWWIASSILFIPTLIVGILVVRKIRKFRMFFVFQATALICLIMFSFLQKTSVLDTVRLAFTSWPLLFMGSIMVTEPFTAPSQKKLQTGYGAIIGFLTTIQAPVFGFRITPELAILIGNLFSYILSPKVRLRLVLMEKQKLSETTSAFTFKLPHKINYLPGQYMEWTLPHKGSDLRGIRRFFTISSSPTEDGILSLGVKSYTPSSTYKTKLFSLIQGDVIWATSISGDFVLPESSSKKLVFIAGGIGITPFRSMIKYLVDRKEKRDIVLFHVCSGAKEFVYKELLQEAEKIGVKTIRIDTSQDVHLTEELLRDNAPDFTKRLFYISGANAMVHSHKKLLSKLGIKSSQIVTDYFPGL